MIREQITHTYAECAGQLAQRLKVDGRCLIIPVSVQQRHRDASFNLQLRAVQILFLRNIFDL